MRGAAKQKSLYKKKKAKHMQLIALETITKIDFKISHKIQSWILSPQRHLMAAVKYDA